MPDLYGLAGGASRKLRELYARDSGGTTRKLRELWGRDAGAVNRKIFSGLPILGVSYYGNYADSISRESADFLINYATVQTDSRTAGVDLTFSEPFTITHVGLILSADIEGGSWSGSEVTYFNGDNVAVYGHCHIPSHSLNISLSKPDMSTSYLNGSEGSDYAGVAYSPGQTISLYTENHAAFHKPVTVEISALITTSEFGKFSIPGDFN